MRVIDRMVAFPGPVGEVPGYLAEPEGDGPCGGIVVLEEWWGLDGHMRAVTRRLAAEGFVALCPDFFHGRLAADAEQAARLKASLSVEDGAADVLAAIDHLLGLPRVQPKRAGVIGFCLGGSFALEAAVRRSDLAAVSPWYAGRVGEFVDRVEEIRAPLFVPFGEVDPAIPLEVVRRFEAALQRAGKAAEVRVYAGAEHAFNNDTNPRYHPEAARDAWTRAIAFFRRHLR